MAFIDVSSVSKTFTTDRAVRCVLDNATLSVDQREFVSIVGFMGCGKSTLLSIMAGLALPVWPADQQANQAHVYLRKVGLASATHRRPSQLSGGMRQRVAIARALATEPDVLFLDDPFGALDALTRANLQQELAQLCSAEERPVTTIMITNSVEEALLLSDRIVPMTHGPRATIGRPVAVAIPKPRTLAQLVHDEDAMRSRAHVVESLTTAVRRPRRPQFTPQPVDALGLTASPE